MFYRCKNCGGNVIYHPDKKKMVCESCGSEESQETMPQKEFHVCGNCGGRIDTTEYTLACRCPYCGTFHILEDKMEGDYKPHLILPFALGKHQAAERLRESEVTETKVYRIVRDFEVSYDKVPVDASTMMDDTMMDLMEPYRYAELSDFNPRVLSGFMADTFEEDSKELLPRAEEKIDAFSESFLSEQNMGYAMLRPFVDEKKNETEGVYYAFLPVWRYIYRYNGKEYPFYVNGQTGKVTGGPPVSLARVFGMSAGVFALTFFFLKMLFYLLEVL